MTAERKFLENLSMHFAKMYMRFLCNMQNFLQVFTSAFNRKIFLRESIDISACVFKCVFAYEFFKLKHIECSAGVLQK